MSTPLAYFLTWTCYGQRLHGDERGSVDREHNVPGTPFLQPDSTQERGDRSRMQSEAVSLTVEMRQVADQGIQELAKERG